MKLKEFLIGRNLIGFHIDLKVYLLCNIVVENDCRGIWLDDNVTLNVGDVNCAKFNPYHELTLITPNEFTIENDILKYQEFEVDINLINVFSDK
jgi:hypothetical protein